MIRLAWLAALIAVGIGLYLCYLHISRTARVSSDGASNALQAWAMLHGNPMLRGWTVIDVSFRTTELPEYTLVEMVRRLQADVLHVSAAIGYTLVVLTGVMLARGRATGREGAIRMLIAAGIMIAPQLGPACSSWSSSPTTSAPRHPCCCLAGARRRHSPRPSPAPGLTRLPTTTSMLHRGRDHDINAPSMPSAEQPGIPRLAPGTPRVSLVPRAGRSTESSKRI